MLQPEEDLQGPQVATLALAGSGLLAPLTALLLQQQYGRDHPEEDSSSTLSFIEYVPGLDSKILRVLGVLAATPEGAGEIMKGDGLQSLVLLLTQQCSNQTRCYTRDADRVSKQEEEEALCAALDLFLKIASNCSLRTTMLLAASDDGGMQLSTEGTKLLFLVHSVCTNRDSRDAVLTRAFSLVSLLCTRWRGEDDEDVMSTDADRPEQEPSDGDLGALLAARWLTGSSPKDGAPALDDSAPPTPQLLQLPKRAAEILRSPTSSVLTLRALATALNKITSVKGTHSTQRISPPPPQYSNN
jgi:hypothetical protein